MVRARVFVGNLVPECTNSKLTELFEKFGTVNRCDIKGTYAFIEYGNEEDAEAAISAMHDVDFMGRNLNVELGGKARRADRSERTGKNGPPETVKLHISGIKMGGNADELASYFEPYGKVVDKHIMTNKDVGFVHLEAKVVEKAMMELEGKPFNGGNMKIEYGQIGKKPTYDRRAPKLTLHVGGVSEEADSKFIEMKFGVFGSIGEVKFLRDKNIAFVDIQEEYAENAIDHLHGSLFFGKEIKVAYSKKNNTRERVAERERERERSKNRYSRVDSYGSRYTPPRNDFLGVATSTRFVFDDFSQLSNLRPKVSTVHPREIDQLIQRRRRLETIHPYERKLLASHGDLPPPPPEFIRLLRDRAELKAQILLYQAECDGRLNMLMSEERRDLDNYGFNSSHTPRARSRSPIRRRVYHESDFEVTDSYREGVTRLSGSYRPTTW